MLRSTSPGRLDSPIRNRFSLDGHRQARQRRSAHRFLVLELQQADVAHRSAVVASAVVKRQLDGVRGRKRRDRGCAGSARLSVRLALRDLDLGPHGHGFQRLAPARR